MTGPWAPKSFLAGLTETVRAALLGRGVRRDFPAGRRLLSEGDESDHVEVLLSGFVKITGVAEGIETLLAIRVPGDVIGETAGLTGQPRMATATACGPVTSVVVRGADFQRFITEYPDAAMRLAATMGERLRWANQRRTDFAAYPPEIRLARVMVDLAQWCGRPTGSGVVIDIPLTQTELAGMVGVSEVTIQRALRDLRARGLVDTGYRTITIPDLSQLNRLADGD